MPLITIDVEARRVSTSTCGRVYCLALRRVRFSPPLFPLTVEFFVYCNYGSLAMQLNYLFAHYLATMTENDKCLCVVVAFVAFWGLLNRVISAEKTAAQLNLQ